MTLKITEGFDMYNGVTGVTGLASRWNLSGSSGLCSLGTGRWFGGQCMTISYSVTQTCAQKLFLGATYSSFSIGMGFRLNIPQTPQNSADIVAGGVGGFYFYQGSVPQIFIRGGENNNIEVYRLGSSTPLGSTPSGSLLVGTWHYVELEAVISDSVGIIRVYIDGELLLNLSGQDTKSSTTLSTIDSFAFGYLNGFLVSTGFSVSIDDIYFTDTSTRLGECRIETIRPDSDFSLGWTPDTGSVNYSRVNETLASSSNYVTTNTINARDLYGIGNLAVNPEAIYAVSAVSFAKKTDATTRGLSNSIQSNGVDAYGTTQYLNASDNRYDSIYELNPDGSVAWTYAAVNAIKAGPKLVI